MHYTGLNLLVFKMKLLSKIVAVLVGSSVGLIITTKKKISADNNECGALIKNKKRSTL